MKRKNYCSYPCICDPWLVESPAAAPMLGATNVSVVDTTSSALKCTSGLLYWVYLSFFIVKQSRLSIFVFCLW